MWYLAVPPFKIKELILVFYKETMKFMIWLHVFSYAKMYSVRVLYLFDLYSYSSEKAIQKSI